MKPTQVQIHWCGYGAAHLPHALRTLALWWCPGVMPVWPCTQRRTHLAHEVTDRNFYCPGTVDPPRDLIGPRYSHDDVYRVVETTRLAGEYMERAGQ